MLYFDRMNIFDGIDVSSKSKECHISRYSYFLSKGFKLQPYVGNRWHDLLMLSMNLSNIAILKIKNVDYRCITTRISKIEAIKSLQNIDFSGNSGIS